jgi:hypothetical protein
LTQYDDDVYGIEIPGIHFQYPELGTRFFLRFALALSRSLAELFALALSRYFLGLKFRAFAFALSRSLIFALFFRAPRFFALFFVLLNFSRSYICDH